MCWFSMTRWPPVEQHKDEDGVQPYVLGSKKKHRVAGFLGYQVPQKRYVIANALPKAVDNTGEKAVGGEPGGRVVKTDEVVGCKGESCSVPEDQLKTTGKAVSLKTTPKAVPLKSAMRRTKATADPEAKVKANQVKKVEIAPAPEAPKAIEPQPGQYAYAPQYACYPQIPYPYYAYANYAFPAPAYYGLPQQMQQPYGAPPGAFHANAAVPSLAPARSKDEPKDNGKNGEKAKPKKVEPMKWQGRTTSEVEEDNMKIAAKEGAYEARKIEPVGLGEDQPVWVVLGDGNPVLRLYAEAKEMKGKWHEDPRFKGSLYLVCEQDKPEKKAAEGGKSENGEKCDKKGKKGGKTGKKAKKAEEAGGGNEIEKKSCTCGK